MRCRKRERVMIILLIISFCLGFGYSTIMRDISSESVYAEEPEVIQMELDNSLYPPTPTVVIIEDNTDPETVLTEDEKILIAKVVYAEAGNQDYIGKRLVVDTILNRVNDPAFPDTVTGVIYQPHQFAHPMGVYTPECYGAVEAECKERLDYDVLWFRKYKYHTYGRPAYQHGDHYFNWRASNEQ